MTKLCKRGHENPDDADLCSTCKLLLPGHKLGTPFKPGHDMAGDRQRLSQEAKAKKWVEDAGLKWDELQQSDKDIIVRAQSVNAAVGIVERALLIIGQYQAKPRANEQTPGEELVVELTAESVESLERSLKTLKRLSGE